MDRDKDKEKNICSWYHQILFHGYKSPSKDNKRKKIQRWGSGSGGTIRPYNKAQQSTCTRPLALSNLRKSKNTDSCTDETLHKIRRGIERGRTGDSKCHRYLQLSFPPLFFPKTTPMDDVLMYPELRFLYDRD